MPPMEWSAFESLVRLADQFGPFLFALLFVLIIPNMAQTYYRRAAMRKAPRASPQELRTYRSYFVTSVAAGIVVMTFSIGWWVYWHLKGIHQFQIAIQDVRANDMRVSADYYSLHILRDRTPGAIPLDDYQFLIVQEQPFRVGDRFTFAVHMASPATGDAPVSLVREEVVVTYDGKPFAAYKLRTKDGKPVLVSLDDGGKSRRSVALPSHSAPPPARMGERRQRRGPS